MLTKEQIVAYRPQAMPIEVPELGEVFVRLITEAEALESSKDAESNMARARSVAKILCDAEGNRLFGDDEVDKILKMPFAVTDSIFNQGMRLNYPEMAKNKDDAEKN